MPPGCPPVRCQRRTEGTAEGALKSAKRAIEWHPLGGVEQPMPCRKGRRGTRSRLCFRSGLSIQTLRPSTPGAATRAPSECSRARPFVARPARDGTGWQETHAAQFRSADGSGFFPSTSTGSTHPANGVGNYAAPLLFLSVHRSTPPTSSCFASSL